MSIDVRVWVCTRKRRLKSGRVARYLVMKWRVGGRSCYESLGPRSRFTAAEVREARRNKELELTQGAAAAYAGKRLTLTQLRDAYARARDADPERGEHAHAVRHAIEGLGDLHVDSITKQHVLDLRINLREKKGKTTGRKLAEGTQIKTLRMLRAMWNWAKEHGFVAENPFAGQKFGTPAPREPRLFSREDVAAMEAVLRRRIDDPRQERNLPLWRRWLLLIRLDLATGLRKSELLHLRWEDVDFDEGLLRIREHREPLPWKLKTRGSKRVVPVDADLVVELRAHELRCGSPYVFVTGEKVAELRRRLQRDERVGNPVGNVDSQFKKIQRQARIAPVGSLHDLRKTCLTNLAGKLPMHVVKEFAGHANISTTANHYLATTPDDARKVREASRALLAG